MSGVPSSEDRRAMISPALVLLAACEGAFPMASGESYEPGSVRSAIHWYIADPRAILPPTGIHVSRSLAKTIRQGKYEIRFDSAYEQVMRSCLRPEGNWISEELISVYTQLHEMGWGHSAETWLDGELVGGVYGFAIGGYFSAESMFHRNTDAGKVALWALVDRCASQGFELIDVQYLTPNLATLGATEIELAEYLERLKHAIAIQTAWGPRFTISAS